MKLTKSHLKELIRTSLQEDWWSNLSSAEQSAYMKKHPKSAKAQQAKKEKGWLYHDRLEKEWKVFKN